MKAILKMDNITKSFGSGHNKIQALKGINLEVNQGEFVFQLLVLLVLGKALSLQ